MEWARSHKPNLDNLRAALDWCSATNDLNLRDELTAAAIPLLSHLSLIEECRMRIQTALTKRPDGNARDEKCEMQLFAGLGMALSYKRGGGQDTNSAWQRCLVNGERVGDIDYQLRAIRGLWTSSFNIGDMENVQRLGRQFDDVAGPTMSSENALMSRRMRGMQLFYHGRITEARNDLQSVFDGYAKQKPGLDVLRFQFDQTVIACVNLSKVLWLQGLPLQATEMVIKSLNTAKLVNHDLSLIYTLAFGACRISINTGDFAAAEKYIEDLFQCELVDRAGPWKYFGQCWKGVLLSKQGRADNAVEVLKDALTGIRDGSFGMHHTRFLAELAFALACAGRVSEGLAAIRKAVEICERLEERWFLAEILRLEGEILALDRGTSIELSQKCFMRAISLAKHQGALAFELRSATSLVRHDTTQGKAESMAMLQSVYSKFVEGFETVDLKEAKAVLDSGLC